ncbi:MAG TPA: DUF2142 domain-containing protein [Acidocella sp.]|nr:DUF2142 domain-containing protein [Acidocella sp.]
MSDWFEVFQRYSGKSAVMALFLLCALPVTVLTALITPPGQSPDEPAHIVRAAGLLHGAVLGVRKMGVNPYTGEPEMLSGVKVKQALLHAAFGPTTQIDGHPVVTADDFLAMRSQPPRPQRQFAHIPNTITYFPLTYVPATLGLALGLLVAGGKPFVCIILARFGMLLAYLALGLLALRIAAYGEALLLTVLLMPMSLFLAGTVNQDGMMIGLACLAGAALTRGTQDMRRFGLVVLVVMLLAKPPYLPLLGVFLLPLFVPGFFWRLRDVVLAMLPVLLWAGLIAALVVVPFDKPSYHPGPLFTGDRSVLIDHTDPAANLHILLAQPLRFFSLPWDTLRQCAEIELDEMIGVLGLLQILMPLGYYVLWCIAGGVALAGLLFSGRPGLTSGGTQAVNFIWTTLLLAANFWLLFVMFYLNWSNVGRDVVDGVQGRYFLPLLPFLLFAIPSLRPRAKLPPLLPALPVALLGLYDIGYIPMRLLYTYYLH